MAPHRFRGIQEDSRSESSSTREKQAGVLLSGISKVRHYAAATSAGGSNLKDVTLATTSVNAQHNGQDGQGTVEKVPFEQRQERPKLTLQDIDSLALLRWRDSQCLQASASLE